MKTKSIFKFMLVVALYAGVMTACKDDLLNANEPSSPMRAKGEILKGSENDNYFYKKKFAVALYSAMSESYELRSFIKKEALKKFNNDYDVLYNYVKDNNVEGTGKTLRDFLTPYFDNEDVSLDEIAYAVPLLTIFVPSLPHEIFSAEKWDCEKYTPYVAVRLRNVCAEVPIFCGKDGEGFGLPYGLIPAFPVVVVKDNECVVLPGSQRFEHLEKEKEYLNVYNADGTITSIPTASPIYNSASGDFPFRISDIAFDKLRIDALYLATGFRPWRGDELEDLNQMAGGEEVREAWEMGGAENGSFWQRDHIYYDINQPNENGRFSDAYHEFFTSFEMTNSSSDPLDLIRPISDQYEGTNGQLDPQLIPNKIIVYDYGTFGSNLPWWFGNDQELFDAFGFDMATEMNPDVSLGDFWTGGSFKFSVDISMFPKVANGSTAGGEQLSPGGFQATANDLFDITYRLSYVRFERTGIIADRNKVEVWCYSVYDVKAKEFYLGTIVGVDIPWRLETFASQMKVAIVEMDESVEYTSGGKTTVTNNDNFEFNFELNQSPVKVGAKWGASTGYSNEHSSSLKIPSSNDDLGGALPFFGNNVIMSQTGSKYKFYDYKGKFCKFTFRPIHYLYW